MATQLSNTPDISLEDYCVFGVATCFLRDDGEIKEVKVVEPIPSAALEAILKGIPTSYQLACAKSVGDVVTGETLTIPTELKSAEQFGEDFVQRVISATRTYKSRPEATSHIPLGTLREDFNYSVERKRVLNAVNVVSKEDNVKQHSHTHKVL